jgi:hypothetical protein
MACVLLLAKAQVKEDRANPLAIAVSRQIFKDPSTEQAALAQIVQDLQ